MLTSAEIWVQRLCKIFSRATSKHLNICCKLDEGLYKAGFIFYINHFWCRKSNWYITDMLSVWNNGRQSAFASQMYKTSRYFSLDFGKNIHILFLSKLTKLNPYWFMSKAAYFLKTVEISCWNQRRKNHPEVMFSILSFIFPSFSSPPFRKHVFM